ncbi:MAG: tetratricopeptide repeat protein [Anaerolineae bacterium]|nr:tetratricopeptide repeat protein [Anaerolineae bacterium]
MYLRTPKRYTRGQRRSPISLRWLWLWILTPIVAYFGIQLYQNREVIGPPIHDAIYNLVDSAQNQIATAAAPTALPTQDPTERLARADSNWREGRIESALQDYEAAVSGAPNDVTAHYRIAFGMLQEDQLEDALVAAERTITANPFSSDAWAIRAMALDWNGRSDEAIASALHALEIDPQSARAMAFLAEAYFDEQEFDLARETVERALETDPDSFEANRVRGLIAAYVEYDPEAANGYFQTAYDLAPNLPYLAVDLAQSMIPDYETAIALLQDTIELNPENARVLFYLGNYYYSGLGNFGQASEYLSRCVQVNPDSMFCQALLGRVQISLEQYSQAAESLQKAIDLGTTTARHFLWMGRAQIALGNCPAAVPFLQKSYELALDQDDGEAVTASAENLAECQSPVPGLAESTPEATVEAG